MPFGDEQQQQHKEQQRSNNDTYQPASTTTRTTTTTNEERSLKTIASISSVLEFLPGSSSAGIVRTKHTKSQKSGVMHAGSYCCEVCAEKRFRCMRKNFPNQQNKRHDQVRLSGESLVSCCVEQHRNDEIHTPSGSLSRLSGTPGRLVTIDTWNGEGGGRRKLFHRIQPFHCRLLFAFLSIVPLLFPPLLCAGFLRECRV